MPRKRNRKARKFLRNRNLRNGDGDRKGIVLKKEKFHGASCTDLPGRLQIKQIASYATTLEHITTYVGQWCDPIVLKAIEKMDDINLSEPQATTAADGTMTEVEKIKFSKRLDRYFMNQERIDKEKKQVYALFYGQMNEDMKTCDVHRNKKPNQTP